MEQGNNGLKKFLTGGVFILLGILLFNSFFVFGAGNTLDTRIGEAKELAKPAKIGIITLTSSCSDCFDIEEILATLREADLDIVKETSVPGNSEKAQELIGQYSIEKLPTIILKGEIEKTSIQGFTQREDALIFDGLTPPYVDALTQQVKGKVDTIIINDKRCEECSDLNSFVQNLEQSGVVVKSRQVLDLSDEKAGEWIQKLGIEKIPALLISDDIDAYPVSDKLKESGLSVKKGYYLIESSAPYVEVNTGKVRGLVSLTMVDDKTCEQCYDVNLHKQIMSQMGIALVNEKTVDINSAEGVQLQVKYDLQKIPTIILTGDLEAYDGFDQIWQQVGTIEDDQIYVFRNIEVLGSGIQYKDLTTGEVTGLAVAPQR